SVRPGHRTRRSRRGPRAPAGHLQAAVRSFAGWRGHGECTGEGASPWLPRPPRPAAGEARDALGGCAVRYPRLAAGARRPLPRPGAWPPSGPELAVLLRGRASGARRAGTLRRLPEPGRSPASALVAVRPRSLAALAGTPAAPFG